MKIVKYLAATLITASLACAASAQTATASVKTPVTSASASAPSTTANLSFGASQVLKLQQAGLGTDVLMNYVNGSADSFALRADDIICLHNAGVPQEVITAMINKDRRTAVAQNVAPTPAP